MEIASGVSEYPGVFRSLTPRWCVFKGCEALERLSNGIRDRKRHVVGSSFFRRGAVGVEFRHARSTSIGHQCSAVGEEVHAWIRHEVVPASGRARLEDDTGSLISVKVALIGVQMALIGVKIALISVEVALKLR
jgi:hypothetical protein